jgi:hypothetical protein
VAKTTGATRGDDVETGPPSQTVRRAPLPAMAPPPARPLAEEPAVATQAAPAPTPLSASPLQSAAELDAYLMTLESRARGKHQATADEVEPGMKAIMRLAPQIGPEGAMEKLREFEKRMREISERGNQ